jgi:hypothetical protein
LGFAATNGAWLKKVDPAFRCHDSLSCTLLTLFLAGMQGHRFLAKSAEQGGYHRIKPESGALSCGMARVCDGLFKNYRWPLFMPFTPL